MTSSILAERSLEIASRDLSSTSAPCRRRRVVGIDLWVELIHPADELRQLAVAAGSTPLRLVGALTPTGHPCWPSSPPQVEIPGARCRFLARDPEVHVSDAAISELLTALGPLRWGGLAKLEERDSVPVYSPFPT